MNKQYTIGIDFGTLSARGILLNPDNGDELAEAVFTYPHGVMDRTLPSQKPLEPAMALQHSRDYLDALSFLFPKLIADSGISPACVTGVGIDFTACTLLPVDKSFQPLCFDERFVDEPHAYVKLWKHHSAQEMADRINRLAQDREESWLSCYGGKISSEWAFPKILETAVKAPAVYDAAYRFCEAADWLSFLLTGRETRSAIFAGYKALWQKEHYPSNDFFKMLDPKLDGIVGTKISENVCKNNEIAGTFNAYASALSGLPIGTKLSLPLIDAHAAMPALNITEAGKMMMIVGTSAVHLIHAGEDKQIPGISGVVKDGVIPGLYTYEAGQSCVGDNLDWFVNHCVPASYTIEAEKRKISIHQLLREKASSLKPGQSGLLALDWLGGNRCTLADSELSGVMLGVHMQTRPEEMYRAWMEACVYGTQIILDAFSEKDILVNEITASGGIAQKDPMMMQIYADVTNCTVKVAGSSQAGARGSAIYAAVAAGIFRDIKEASSHLALPVKTVYYPHPEHHAIYRKLYEEYKTLYHYFGQENQIMKRLKQIAR